MNSNSKLTGAVHPGETPAEVAQSACSQQNTNENQNCGSDQLQELKRLLNLNSAYQDLESVCKDIYAVGGLGRIIRMLNRMNIAYLDQLHDDMDMGDFIALKDEACCMIDLCTFFVNLETSLDYVKATKEGLLG